VRGCNGGANDNAWAERDVSNGGRRARAILRNIYDRKMADA